LGDGTYASQSNPVQVQNLTGVVKIAAGQYHSVALTHRNDAAAVTSITGIVAIAAGDDHSLAVKNDGSIYSWGYNNQGQLGTGAYADQHLPFHVGTVTGATAVAAGTSFSAAYSTNGTVWAWGLNTFGQLARISHRRGSKKPSNLA
jgi:alpha-tubulin suppressor-like RCC1 family protein